MKWLRVYLAIIGVLLLYTFVHEFAYRRFTVPDGGGHGNIRTIIPDSINDTLNHQGK